MSVDPDITKMILAEELEAIKSLASIYGWTVETNLDALTVVVKMTSSIDGQIYIVEARCDDYKALPPFFEFIHPQTGERGTLSCYPADGSFFHPTPCICAQWSRKAYTQHGGPHGDWQMANWMDSRPGTTTLGDMMNIIQRQINRKGQYRGRMA